MSLFHGKPNTHINHVAIKVTDVNRSLTFYKEILGLKVLEQTKTKVHLTVDGRSPLITLISLDNPEKNPNKTTGLYHFALLLPSRDDLAQFLQHLLDHRIPFGASDHHVSEAIYLNDPDGNGIEVYCDRPRDSWDWVHERVTMETERLNESDLLTEKTKDWEFMSSETVLGHLHLHVNNLDESKMFFEAIGFSVVNEFHGAVFMSAGKYHHHIAFNIWNGIDAKAPKDNNVGMKSYSIVYDSVSVRDQILASLQQMNKEVKKIGDAYIVRDMNNSEILLLV